MNVALLALCVAVLLWWLRGDAAEYVAFKQLTDTRDRQRFYRRWLGKSFLCFFGVTVLALALLHRLSALKTMPPEFLPLALRLRALVPADQIPDRSFIFGVISAGLFGGVLGGLLITVRLQKKGPKAMLGDVEAILPRNTPETAWAALLALNAGLSEESFFRLLLPLLLVLLLHNALLAFALAVLIFGLAHRYQGVVGVIATTVLALVLTVIYLATESLWLAVAVHAGIDLLNLVVRPSVARLFSSRVRVMPQANSPLG